VVVVITVVVFNTFVGDRWWWSSQTSLSMRMAVMWGFADVVDGGGGHRRGRQHVCG